MTSQTSNHINPKLKFALDAFRAIAIGMCVISGQYWLAAVLFVIP